MLNWDRFMRARPRFLNGRTRNAVCDQIQAAESSLQARNALGFIQRLPGPHKVRVLAEFRHHCAYLDVETTGLGREAVPTTAVLYDGRLLRNFVRERNLDQLGTALSSYSLLLTYNGTEFDLPLLKSTLGIEWRGAHLDLCPALREFGYRGGLKACEIQAGIERRYRYVTDGERAKNLWDIYSSSRDNRALQLLLAYNAQDVLSLEILAWKVYARSMELYPKRVVVSPGSQPQIDFDPRWESLLCEN